MTNILNKLLFIFIYLFIFNTGYVRADFFSVCKINKNDTENIKYILNNSNSKFIPYNIEEIKNQTFQKALYLSLFYTDGIVPDDVIDVVGIDVVKQVLQFKNCAINYILKKSNGDENRIKMHFESMDLQIDDLLFILKNKHFQTNDYGEDIAISILRRVFQKKVLSLDDIVFLTKKFGSNIKDDMILNQIRLYLWNSNNNISFLEELITSKVLKYRAKKIKEFNDSINKKTEKIIKYNNGKTKKRIVNLTAKQKYNICKNWLGYDEYIDLVCVENNKRDLEYVEKILKSNLNPSFLPEAWLPHRLFFVREAINNKEKIDDDIYEAILNGGELYGNSFYTQKFLAGFVAYLKGNYDDAIIHFNECAENSNFSDYNAKAYYWLGLSYRKFGKKILANKAFEKAKQHIFTFYGQLGAMEIGSDPEKDIANYILSFREQPDILCNDINFVLGYLQQYKSKNINLSSVLLSYINKNTDKTKLFNAIVVLKNDFERKSAETFGFHALRFGVMLDDINFPIIDHNDDSLVNAVIKKESNFRRIIGGCGERGIMQIMPSTGRMLAKNMGIKYDKRRLLNDDKYNVSIGKYYLENLLYRFDDNKVLALASYNAGKGNVEKWIIKNGDPRNMKTNEEVVEWIEKIPFVFTRSYVTYILGFEMVYDVIKKLNLDFEKNML